MTRRYMVNRSTPTARRAATNGYGQTAETFSVQNGAQWAGTPDERGDAENSQSTVESEEITEVFKRSRIPTSVGVECALAGFEGVIVTYDMTCSDADVKEWQSSLGRSDSGVIESIDGWDVDRWGTDDPFGENAPVAFRIWACQRGYWEAMRQINHPNLKAA